MFSMCSELTPRARIPVTRIPQLMQPCSKKDLHALAQNIEINDRRVSLHNISTISKERKFTDLDADGSADVVESSSSCRRCREPLLTIHRPDLPRDIAVAAGWLLGIVNVISQECEAFSFAS